MRDEEMDAYENRIFAAPDGPGMLDIWLSIIAQL
tara:strand:- start:14 stop:115 length:102 start_codon:yes stop_codon:yes gene_type:complete